MATQLFKDGEVVWIDPLDIQNHLLQGWSLEDPNAPKKLPAGIEIINQKEPEVLTNLAEPGPAMTEVKGGSFELPKQHKKPGRKPKSR
jgi:hypothetical protein